MIFLIFCPSFFVSHSSLVPYMSLILALFQENQNENLKFTKDAFYIILEGDNFYFIFFIIYIFH